MYRHQRDCVACQKIKKRGQELNIYEAEEASSEDELEDCFIAESETSDEEVFTAAVDEGSEENKSVDEVSEEAGSEEEGREEEGSEEEGREEGSEEEGSEEEDVEPKRNTMKAIAECATKSQATFTHAALINAVCTKLTQGEKEGYVYVLHDEKKPGLVKLGYTKDIKTRLRRYKYDCGLSPIPVSVSDPVKHSFRIEKLAKLDLQHLLRPWKCRRCNKKHTEWFEIDQAQATSIVSRWVDWQNREQPYDSEKKLKPLWEHLIKFGRVPEKGFGQHDHTARQIHWDWLLSTPTADERRVFRKQNAGEKKQLPYRESIVKPQGTSTATQAPVSNGPLQGSFAKASERAIGKQNTNARFIFNNCHFGGNMSVGRVIEE